MTLMTQKIRPLHNKQTLNLKATLDEALKINLRIELIGERYQKCK